MSWAAAAFAVNLVSHFSGSRSRKRANREERRLTGEELEQESYELGRVERARAVEERSLFAAAGISTASGSAAAVEGGISREAVYQQEAILAGLPNDQQHRNPFASFSGQAPFPPRGAFAFFARPRVDGDTAYSRIGSGESPNSNPLPYVRYQGNSRNNGEGL